jgi:DNA-binding MarR family transcriptional regulator
MIHNESEISILEHIYAAEVKSARLTQRELAHKAGLSLGMTNALLRRLAERGWVKLTRLSARSVRYALTPDGIGEILRRTAGYFRRAAQNAGLYRDRLEEYVLAVKGSGAGTLVLSGTSEVDFILEFLCERHGLVFVKSADPERTRTLLHRPGVALLVSEQSEYPDASDGATFLAEILASTGRK